MQSLNITYMPPRVIQGYAYPVADNLLMSSHWSHLTKLVLTDLRLSPGAGLDAAVTFLSDHPTVEILHLDVTCGIRGGWGRVVLPPNTLPCLREIKASKEVVNAILECPCDVPRPLETIKGVRLSCPSSADSSWDQDHSFFANLRRYKAGLKRIELSGWSEMDDIRRLVECVPGLTWLDIGKKTANGGPLVKDKFAPVNNPVEWTILLSALPELTTFHGIRFFYFVADGIMARKMDEVSVSASDRSRIRKNDEIASLLAWRCPKLRSVDYWDDTAGRVIVLVRSSGACINGNATPDEKKVGWEVRRVKT